MLKTSKYIGIALAIFLLIVVLSLIIISTIDLNPFKKNIESNVTKMTGRLTHLS